MTFSTLRLLIVLCFVFTTGCLIPRADTFDPLKRRPWTGEKSPETSLPKLTTILVDSETRQVVSDAQVVLILQRQAAYIPDSSEGRMKRPTVVVDKFDQLTYRESELYVWPFFALGTIYPGAHVFIYKRGYTPVAFKTTNTGSYPSTVEMVKAPVDEAKAMLIKMAADCIKEVRWKDAAKKEIGSRLD